MKQDKSKDCVLHKYANAMNSGETIPATDGVTVGQSIKERQLISDPP